MDPGSPGGGTRKYERRAGSGLLVWAQLDGTGVVLDRGAGAFLELSLDGAAFLCARTFETGSPMELEIQLRDDLVRLAGRVVRCGEGLEGGEGRRVVISIERATPNYAQLLAAYFPG